MKFNRTFGECQCGAWTQASLIKLSCNSLQRPYRLWHDDRIEI